MRPTQAAGAAPPPAAGRSGQHATHSPHRNRSAAGREASADGEPPFLLEPPTISLPTGGGAIRAIDEQFAVNAVTGTMSLSLPLPFTPGPRDFTPPLRLSYDTGAGNGIAGLGWSLTNSSIRRRTDRAVPRYADDDTFALAGGDDLVPAATWDGTAWELDDSTVGTLRITRFRPRDERDLARIERITDGDGTPWWRVMSRDDVTTFFGLDERSRIADPAHPERVLAWLPALSFDDVGNCCVYEYAAEDLTGVAERRHDANRRPVDGRPPLASFANQHLVAVRYGNRTPYYVDEAAPYRPVPPGGAFRFHVAFDYGQHDADSPAPDDDGDWVPRSDPFSTYRAGFEVRTNRLLRRVLLFHQFDGLRGGQPCLVRSLDLAHSDADGVSTLTSITHRGHALLADGTYSTRSMPPFELDYQPLEWSTEVRTLGGESARHLPSGVTGNYQWVDLDGEGIAGVLVEQTDAWRFQENLGDPDGTGQLRLGPQRVVAAKPSLSGLAAGDLRLVQLDADGRHQVAVHTRHLQGYYGIETTPATGNGSVEPVARPGRAWTPFRPYPHAIRVDLTSAHVRQLDLVGDGRADVLVADEGAFVWFRSLGTGGHEPARRAPHPSDEERAPQVVFRDDVQSLFLADMSGDGLVDMVRIRNGDVSYWPNLGYGRFGARVAMDDSPRVEGPDTFHPAHVRLADLTGTGPADLVYLGADGCHAYLNHSGNGWGERLALADLPSPRPVDVSTVDLFGNGTTCLVWSSSLPADSGRALRYLDPTGGRKPHLLTGYRNHLGREVSVEYRPSTWFSTRDKLAGRPWISRLPFPVHCVERVEHRDVVAGSRRVSTYAYRHGYFDAAEREFRGFAVVDQVDAEDFANWSRDGGALVDRTLYQTPVLTRTWFHTGADQPGSLADRLDDEHWARRLAAAGFAVGAGVGDEPRVAPTSIERRPGVDDETGEDRRTLARHAARACRGTVLRREVFALDAPPDPTAEERRLELTPFTVATVGSTVVVVQPPLADAPAVVKVEQREAVTLTYERGVDDPRVEHQLNVRFDELGFVRESAHITYGRRTPDASLPAATRDAQARTTVTYTVDEPTNDVVDDARHRLRLPARSTTFELSGLEPAGSLFTAADFRREGFDVLIDSVPRDAVDAAAPAGGEVHRRVRRRKESTYYGADAATALAVGQLHARALPAEGFELAATPALLADVFGDVLPAAATDAVMAEGGYVRRDGDWYVPAGRWEYVGPGETVDDAIARGFAPVAMTDALGARTTVGYLDGDIVLRDETVDAAGNRTAVSAFDLRTLSPSRLIDPNGNFTEVVVDELGLTKATAVVGKTAGDADGLGAIISATTPTETAAVVAFWAAVDGDDPAAVTTTAATLLGSASSRQVYDLDRHRATGGAQPPVVATIVRERHAADDPASPVQVTFEYSNGAGKVEMTKAPAEPGPAARVRLLADGSVAVDEVDTAALVPPRLRWIGSGRTLVNNKGDAVKEYEPFFSHTASFETAPQLVESGVTRVVGYDPLDRPDRVDFPDGTFSETAYRTWSIVESDRNDTVDRSTWHADRVDRQIDAALVAEGRDPMLEAEAAVRAAAHAETPFARHLDPAGRPILAVEHLGDDPAQPGVPRLLATVHVLDAEGQRTSVVDPRSITTISYRYDRRGTMLSYDGPDGGRRWMLHNVVGDPLRLWDQRGHECSFDYDDPLHRVTAKRVRGGDGPQPLDHVIERVEYGEGRPGDTEANLRTRVAVRYDTAGRSTNDGFDLHGNLTARTRRFATDYRSTPNWDVADPDLDTLLDAEVFTTSEAYDAVDRVTRRVTPDGTVHEPGYNAGNLLESVRVTIGAVTEVVVAAVDYDARGMRQRLVAGSGVTTTYRYDAQNFRLIGLTSRRPGGEVLQDLAFTYDPVGNLAHQTDRAVPTVWFANAMVTGESAYRYDPSYQLVEATGREHVGQLAFGTTDNTTDGPMTARHDPGDVLAWRNYTERYRYDAGGNLDQVAHVAGPDGTWTRDYTYDATSNRLLSTNVGGQPYPVSHHSAHGYIDGLPHLSLMRWNFREELQAVASQRVAGGTPETTWYVYDGDGVRVRKVTDAMVPATAPAGTLPARRFERYTVEGVEIERQYTGVAVTMQRHTTHVMDDTARIAMIERDTTPGGAAAPPLLVRHQLANHLGSATVEVDGAGRVISYEEYHPFGTTAYQGVDRSIAAAAKRFRYTGMERDDESGLEHHAARYYVPWLGRWLSPDRHADQLDGNRYAYVRNNPLAHRDRNGQYEEPVHGAATYRLALAAGFTEVDAARIAIATAGMDHDKATNPGDDIWEMQKQIWLGRTQRYHFPSQEKALADIRSDIDKGANDLEQFGRHLHSLEDVGFKDAPGPHMRGTDRLLSPATGMIGLALIGAGAIVAIRLVQAGHSEWGAIAGGLLLAFGLYAFIFALRADGVGHPTYDTEKGAYSHSFSHVADEAFQDPKANTRQLEKIYGILKEAAEARYGHPVATDDAAAAKAIADVVAEGRNDAETAAMINDYVNARPKDANGNEVMSYSEAIEQFAKGRWTPNEIDASVNDKPVKHTPQMVPIR